jgi:hypothetical protein
MPVSRHRDVADMPPPERAASALAGLAAACESSELTAAIGVTRIGPRGVRRFRSVEEADAQREQWSVTP